MVHPTGAAGPPPPQQRGPGGWWVWAALPGQPAAWQWHPDAVESPVRREWRWVGKQLLISFLLGLAAAVLTISGAPSADDDAGPAFGVGVLLGFIAGLWFLMAVVEAVRLLGRD